MLKDPVLLSALASSIEYVINDALRYDPSSKQRIYTLAGESVAIVFIDHELVAQLTIFEEQLSLSFTAFWLFILSVISINFDATKPGFGLYMLMSKYWSVAGKYLISFKVLPDFATRAINSRLFLWLIKPELFVVLKGDTFPTIGGCQLKLLTNNTIAVVLLEA